MPAPWEVELEPEVERWLLSLRQDEFNQVRAHVELLEEQGVLLHEPHTRQLEGKLRELRFHLAGQPRRISYYIVRGRRVIPLTVFAKTRRRERREMARAKRAMERCIWEGHDAE